MSFQEAGVLRRFNQRVNHSLLDIPRDVLKNICDLAGDVEHRYVVDIVAYALPSPPYAVRPIPQSLFGSRNISTRFSQPVLEGQGVEEHQAADAQCSQSVILPCRFWR